MIKCSFFKSNGNFYKFRIHGHSGYSEEGSDIVCAAVSSMAMLTMNTITDLFGVKAEVEVDENAPLIVFEIKSEDERACALIAGLYRECEVLANDYAENVRVTVN